MPKEDWKTNSCCKKKIWILGWIAKTRPSESWRCKDFGIDSE